MFNEIDLIDPGSGALKLVEYWQFDRPELKTTHGLPVEMREQRVFKIAVRHA